MCGIFSVFIWVSSFKVFFLDLFENIYIYFLYIYLFIYFFINLFIYLCMHFFIYSCISLFIYFFNFICRAPVLRSLSLLFGFIKSFSCVSLFYCIHWCVFNCWTFLIKVQEGKERRGRLQEEERNVWLRLQHVVRSAIIKVCRQVGV